MDTGQPGRWAERLARQHTDGSPAYALVVLFDPSVWRRVIRSRRGSALWVALWSRLERCTQAFAAQGYRRVTTEEFMWGTDYYLSFQKPAIALVFERVSADASEDLEAWGDWMVSDLARFAAVCDLRAAWDTRKRRSLVRYDIPCAAQPLRTMLDRQVSLTIDAFAKQRYRLDRQALGVENNRLVIRLWFVP